MSYTTPTLSDLITRITDDIATRMQDTTARIRYSLPWVASRALAGAVYDLHGYSGYLAKQLFITTATGAYLDLHGAIRAMPREPAKASEGYTVVPGTIGQTLTLGHVFTDESGNTYKSTADVTFTTTNDPVPVKADNPGAFGNLEAGSLLTMASPPAGFGATTYVNADGLVGGADLEGDEAYRSRLLYRIRRPPHGGSIADYRTWLEEADVDVSGSWSFEYPDVAAGEVAVYFTTASGPIPTQDQIDDAQTYLESVKPRGTVVTVAAPDEHAVDFTIALHVLDGYDLAEVKAEIEKEISALFATYDMTSTGGVIRNSKLRNAIDNAAGVDWYTLDGVDGGPGTGDVVLTGLPDPEFPTVGNVTWS